MDTFYNPPSSADNVWSNMRKLLYFAFSEGTSGPFGVSEMTYKSYKAQAWQLVALWAEQCIVGDFDVEEDVKRHIIDHVVPSLKSRAIIIERNKPLRS